MKTGKIGQYRGGGQNMGVLYFKGVMKRTGFTENVLEAAPGGLGIYI